MGFPATILVLLLSFGKRLFSISRWRDWLHSPAFQSGFLTIFLFTSITHAFQNARYFFFYVYAFEGIGGSRARYVLLVTSFPTTFLMTVYYKLALGM